MQFSLKKDFQIPYLGSKLIQFSKEVPHVTFLHIYKYYHLCTIGYDFFINIMDQLEMFQLQKNYF
jgi:hypothetical protein